MMYSSSSERTPLLQRNGGPVSNGSRRRPRPQPMTDRNQSEEEENDKRDRRSGLDRHWSSLSQWGQRRWILPRFAVPLSRTTGTDYPKTITTASTDGRYYYYEDTTNEESWSCTFGTREDHGIWWNHSDRVGTLMATMVWVLYVYSAATIGLLALHGHCPIVIAGVYLTICALALASHAKTSLTDPGAVSSGALPLAKGVDDSGFYTMCSLCQTYKPDRAHHCRICDRCVSCMDHHCPWMNNCIGARNMKHFILFLLYTWTACVLSLLLFFVNYFYCNGPLCEFDGLEIQLVRAMTWLGIGALLFTTSMLVSVMYGIMTGVGTIDRLKRKASNTWNDSEDEPIPLTDIFGIASIWVWWLPIDPIFEDYDAIMGYATHQRLLRKDVILSQQQQRTMTTTTPEGNPTTRDGVPSMDTSSDLSERGPYDPVEI